MLTNLFNKEYPEFWKKYNDSFKRKATKYVVISMETSGLDTEKDVIMGIAATSVVGNRILIKDSFELFIQHGKEKTDELANEFITVSKFDKLSEEQALINLLGYLDNAVLIGHRINFDIEMINECLHRMKLGKLKNEAFDIEAMFNKWVDTNDTPYSLEDMSKQLKISISERNSVSDDAYSIAILFLKLKEKLGIQ
ncbi:exonuclease domain-containing protein [Flavobacterium sp. 20NA77.7]|uniref:Exonuclease domain-containing protein n=1 Tax=Flavobacterium nakdongensis TaxID=3073563 RepID=A0ABY9RBY7_9FLAO|nr:exonuclease domain-containing protein [Flavobacterium sp. 20NA77.7]WMW78758.1 exonuclease domain-containing protein [Flavobacterium sp. 20NA77.7]